MLNPTGHSSAPSGRRRVMVGQSNAVAERESCCWPGCGRSRYDAPDAPPVCGTHLIECASYAVGGARELMARMMGGPHVLADEPPAAEGTVVYYVRVGDHVKIGTTSNIRSRVRSLAVDPTALLATEPGDRRLEAQRHGQFAAERVYANRELFNPSQRLLAHIAALQSD